ncbi:MAG: hypothetical protein IKW60_05420 [Clostridia bacterium]|nr:hypothetical protein [Clostridia bacterium]
MIRRIICVIIVICFVISTVGVIATSTDNNGNYQENLAMLKALRIVLGYGETEPNPLEVAKKNVFINFLMNTVSENGFSIQKNETALIMAQQIGVIEDAQTIGDDTLKYEEMLKMGVAILGYRGLAENNGGYPAGYLQMASRIGISQGISGKEEVSNAEMIQFLVNIIEADYMDRTSWDEEGGNYEIIEKLGILEKTRNIYHIIGVVDANDLGGIYGGAEVLQDCVSINGELYQAGVSNVADMLGYKVDVYAEKINGSEMTILHARPHLTVETIDVELENMVDVDETFDVVTYYKNETDSNTKEIKLAKPFAFLLNGKAYADYTKTDFTDGNGSITFVDNEGDGFYDVVQLKRYESMIVSALSSGEKIIYNEFEDATLLPILKLSDYTEEAGHIEIYRNGEKAELSAIEEEDVLDVYRTQGSGTNKIRIDAWNQKVSASITRYNQDTARITTSLDEYKLSDTYKKAALLGEKFAVSILPGRDYILYLNGEGRVIGLKKGATDGYITGFLRTYAEEGLFTPELMLRILTEDGEWNTFVVADSLKINGETGGTPQGAKLRIENEVACPGIIRFTLNQDGEINNLELPQTFVGEKEEERLTATSELKYNYRGGNQSFASQYYLAKDAVVFMIPKDSRDNEQLYKLGTVSNMVSDKEYIFKGYDVDEYKFIKTVMISATDSEIKETGREAYFVKEKGEILLSNGDSSSIVYVVSNSYRELTLIGEDTDTFDQVKKGDVIKCSLNSEGFVNDANVLYSMSSGTVASDMTSTHASSAIIKGDLVKADRSGGRILLNFGGTENKALRIPSTINAIIYDTDSDQIIYGTLEDALPGDFVIADSYWSQIQNLFLIRN